MTSVQPLAHIVQGENQNLQGVEPEKKKSIMVGIRIMLLFKIHKCRWIMSFAFFWKLEFWS